MEERLQKYLARCGVDSRRKCEEIILAGKVKVNGKTVTELGTKINAEKDTILLDGALIKPRESKLYIMLNKPEGVITSVKDERGRKTVIDLLGVEERVFPIGRLDYDTSGLLLLTNDGEIYNKIIHPRKEVNKTYIAKVRGVFTQEERESFMRGVKIDNYVTAPSKIENIKVLKDTSIVAITIHEGKNRQVRKMCSAFNHPVITLKRVSLGALTLEGLDKGKWRYLTENEINYLRSL